jgi:hypothetical protein
MEEIGTDENLGDKTGGNRPREHGTCNQTFYEKATFKTTK